MSLRDDLNRIERELDTLDPKDPRYAELDEQANAICDKINVIGDANDALIKARNAQTPDPKPLTEDDEDELDDEDFEEEDDVQPTLH